jgi:hypothetical protein
MLDEMKLTSRTDSKKLTNAGEGTGWRLIYVSMVIAGQHLGGRCT